MTDQPDYRLYISEKFEGISKLMNAQFENIHDKLDTIEEQTKKTNGRVTREEEEVRLLRERLANHIIECPAQKQIADLRGELIEYTFFKRYPKLTAIIIAIFAIGVFIAAYGTFSTLHNNIKNQKTDTTINRIDENTK